MSVKITKTSAQAKFESERFNTTVACPECGNKENNIGTLPFKERTFYIFKKNETRVFKHWRCAKCWCEWEQDCWVE